MKHKELWENLLGPGDKGRKKLLRQRADLLQYWSENPWNFLSGTDVDGEPLILTTDEKEADPKDRVKPYPGHKPYLKELVSVLHEEPIVLVDKCRQMLVSWTCLLVILWDMMFHPGSRWLFSKSTEDEAKEMLRDKLRAAYSRLPPWVQHALPVPGKPQSRALCKATGSYVLAVAQNVAHREAHGGTATGVFMDEASLQQEARAVWEAAQPMTSRFWAVATAQPGNPGDTWFCETIERDLGSPMLEGTRQTVPGFRKRYTSTGFCVLEIDYQADPERRAPRWAIEMRRILGENAFRREILRDRTTSAGGDFYPEFGKVKDRAVRPARGLMDGPVFRGWDFGWRYPACVWLQVDARGRVFFLREVMPEQIDTYSFRDLVLWLSGQFPFEQLPPRALDWANSIMGDAALPKPPWFGHGSSPVLFRDYAGPEANKTADEVEGESKERTRAMILAAGGVVLNVWTGSPKAREDVFRRLLIPQDDGLPLAFFDPACKILVKGMEGGISFPKATRLKPVPDEPRKDGYFDNIHDAAGYALVNAVSVSDAKPARPTFLGYQDRAPIHGFRGERIDLRETREPPWAEES